MATKRGEDAIKKNQKAPNLKVFEYEEQEIVTGNGVDLIQNCDLPPPMKIFTSFDHKIVINSMNKKRRDAFNYEDLDDFNGKLGLLKALRLSQTRAREAEEKYSGISKEKDRIYHGLMEDSIRIFGYKQLVRFLEFQVSMLEKENKINSLRDDDDDGKNCGLTLIMALTLCFGVAGFGFAIGYKYFWF